MTSIRKINCRFPKLKYGNRLDCNNRKARSMLQRRYLKSLLKSGVPDDSNLFSLAKDEPLHDMGISSFHFETSVSQQSTNIAINLVSYNGRRCSMKFYEVRHSHLSKFVIKALKFDSSSVYSLSEFEMRRERNQTSKVRTSLAVRIVVWTDGSSYDCLRFHCSNPTVDLNWS
jgi:hypothetical protein